MCNLSVSSDSTYPQCSLFWPTSVVHNQFFSATFAFRCAVMSVFDVQMCRSCRNRHLSRCLFSGEKYFHKSCSSPRGHSPREAFILKAANVYCASFYTAVTFSKQYLKKKKEKVVRDAHSLPICCAYTLYQSEGARERV